MILLTAFTCSFTPYRWMILPKMFTALALTRSHTHPYNAQHTHTHTQTHTQAHKTMFCRTAAHCHPLVHITHAAQPPDGDEGLVPGFDAGACWDLGMTEAESLSDLYLLSMTPASCATFSWSCCHCTFLACCFTESATISSIMRSVSTPSSDA